MVIIIVLLDDLRAGLQVWDVSDPTAPRALSAPLPLWAGFPTGYLALALLPEFTYTDKSGLPHTAPVVAVVGYGGLPDQGVFGEFYLVSLESRSAPTIIGKAHLGTHSSAVPQALLLHGNFALVASIGAGLQVVDLLKAVEIQNASPLGPALQGRLFEPLVGGFDFGGLPIPAPVGLVASQKTPSRAYVGERSRGAFEVNLGGLPLLSVSLLRSGPVLRLALAEGVPRGDITVDLLLLGTMEGLTILNLTDPSVAPVILALPSPPFGLTAHGPRGLAFVNVGTSGLLVVDLRNLTPTLLGTASNLGFAAGTVVVDARFAYVAAATSGVQIVHYDPHGVVIHLSGTPVATDLNGTPLPGIFLLTNDTATPPNPTMPTITLRATLPPAEQWRAERIAKIRWEITLDYHIIVPPARGRDRNLGNIVQGECDGLRLPPNDEAVGVCSNWPTQITFLESKLNEPLPIPWPPNFIGGGELRITATPVLAGGTPESQPTTADVTAGRANLVVVPNPKAVGQEIPYTIAHSPGSDRPRIEGQLMYLLDASQTVPAVTTQPPVDGSLKDNALAKQGNATVDPNFKPAVIAYLMSPSGNLKAGPILTAVGEPRFFRVIAYLESLDGAKYAHFRKLQFNSQTVTTGQPAEAVYPQLNAIPPGPPFSTDGGFGLMQLTDPPPTYSQIWDWRRNIDSAIDRVKGMLQRARDELALHPLADPSEVPEWLKLETYQHYNGGHYWTFNKQLNAWLPPQRPLDKNRWKYGDKAFDVETSPLPLDF